MARKIRVLFDANPLVRQKTGVGYYTEGVITALSKIPELELVGHYFAPRRGATQLPRQANLTYTHNSWLVGMFAKALRKLGLRLPWELLARRRADVLLFPDFTLWPSFFNTPTILTIHDLTYVDHSEYVRQRNLKYLRRYVKRDAHRAQLILTVSEFTKRRLMDEFGLTGNKILVEPIPPAKPLPDLKVTNLPQKFILFISTIEPRKNLGNLVEAYNLLPDVLKEEYALVVAGGLGWDSDETWNRIQQLQAEKINIVTMGYVNDAVRTALYKNALMVVVPSFYEGFGMPILEAMSYGTPVAASNLEVFKEVGGNAAVYFEPHSVESIRETIIKILGDSGLRKKLVEKGKAQLKKYSWQKVADDINEAIERLAG